jgi:hypothetical protein
MIGKIAKNEDGELGVITCQVRKNTPDGLKVEWHGVGFDGMPWQSQKPEVVADTIDGFCKESFVVKGHE